MQTILIPTDFSPVAGHAAIYGFNLAKQLKANIQLCHAENGDTDTGGTMAKLETQAKALTSEVPRTHGFIPLVKYAALSGTLAEAANTLSADTTALLLVLGTSGTGHQHKGFTGRDSKELIETVSRPILLVPPMASVQLPKKIAFATDLDDRDLPVLYSLATMARDLQAEIVIVYIHPEMESGNGQDNRLQQFLAKADDAVRFIRLSCKPVQGGDVAEVLNEIVVGGTADMLVMSHSRQEQMQLDIDTGNSYTLRMATNLHIPLLIYPKNLVPAIHPLF